MSLQKCFKWTPVFALLTQSAFALNLQGYRFSDSYRYSLLDDSLQEKFDGRYVITASYGVIHSPFYYSDTYLHERREKIIDANHILTTGFSYYLSDRISVGLDLNAVHNTVFNDTHTTLGDSVVKAKFNLVRGETFSFSLNPQVFIPTGDESNFSSMGSVGGALSAVGEKSFNKFHVLASVGALSAKDNAYVDVDHRQLLLTQLGLSYDVSEKFNLNLESYRNFPLVNDTLQDDGKYFLTGKHKTTETISTYFGAGATGLNRVQGKSLSAFFGIKFSEAAPKAAVAVTDAVQERQVSFETVYFGHDKSTLQKNELEKLESMLEDLRDVGVVIEGYASSPGSDAYNFKLTERRANFVKKYLINKGIPESSLEIMPYGENFDQDPIEANNRRVILKINQ